MKLTPVRMLLLLALAACAAPARRPPEQGPERSTAAFRDSSVACLRNDDTQEYLTRVWRALKDAWTLPADVSAGQRVTVSISFDRDGRPQQPVVAESTNDALRRSVDDACEKVALPDPPPQVAQCLATARFRADFRNPERR